MMNDRELLEMAAKAAGNGATWRGSDAFKLYSMVLPSGTAWNPLDDDGDALRLAVRLQLTIHNEHINAGVAYCTGIGDATAYPVVDSGSDEDEVIPDDYIATRRAIVRAAAEIGKSMEGK